MSLMHADLVEKLRRGGNFACLLELGEPFSKKYSRGGWNSKSGGRYVDRIVQWGNVVRQVSDPSSGNVPAGTMSVDISDVSGELSRIFEGELGDDASGATVVARLAEKSLDETKWFTFFSGVLSEWNPQSGRTWTLHFRTDDLALSQYSSFPIKQSEFPEADPKVWGQEAPAVYGRHESFGSTGGGMIPALLVDKTRNRYMLSRWRLKSVPRMYVAGTVVTSGFAVESLVHLGTMYTFVTFSANQGTALVSADVHGYDETGDGSGDLIENPADQIAHALTTSVFGRHTFGDWASTDARIDSDALTAAAEFFSRKGMRGSAYLKTKLTGHGILSEWMKSWDARAFWSPDGKLKFAMDEHVIPTIYPAQVVKQSRDDLDSSLSLPYLRQMIDRVKVNFMFSAATDKYINGLDVNNPASLSQASEESLEMKWAYASLAE